jgi:hypothetical protein
MVDKNTFWWGGGATLAPYNLRRCNCAAYKITSYNQSSSCVHSACLGCTQRSKWMLQAQHGALARTSGKDRANAGLLSTGHEIKFCKIYVIYLLTMHAINL